MQHDPFEEAEACDSENEARACGSKDKPRRVSPTFFIVKEVIYEAATPRQINDYLRDNYQEGMSIIKGFQSLPRRKETFEF